VSEQPLPPPGGPGNEAARTAALVAYLCLLAGYFTGLFWLIGGIWAMVKRSESVDSLFIDHFDNIIHVFWWGIGLTAIGVVLAPFIIGYLVLLGAFIWSVFRIVKGLARLTSDKPYR
tara:strand:- start:23471 stop:23821 length:351 start_codon:yes stop_codon:yes gene_type:complete